MLHGEALGPLLGAIALGAVHGIEPGHGWPVAASYALDQTNKWFAGLTASLVLGVGHLVSSIAMVAAFFYAKAYFDLTRVNEPITVVGDVHIGGPVSIVAGVLLVGLGVREYRHGHSHGHGTSSHEHDGHSHEHDGHSHEHDGGGTHQHGHGGGDHAHPPDHGHGRDHSHAGDHSGPDHDHAAEGGVLARVRRLLPGGGHSHGSFDGVDDRGLLGLAWFAFVLGFAHEEEFEIIALCAGSTYCLELMSAYALTVVAGIVALTLLLVAGYRHYEDRVERYTPYLPAFSAAVLVVMGVGFVTGLF